MSQVSKTPIIAFTVILALGLGIVVIGSTSPIKPGIGAVLALLASIASAPLAYWLRHPGLLITIELGIGVLLVIIIVNWLHGISPLTSLKWYYNALRALITPIARFKP